MELPPVFELIMKECPMGELRAEVLWHKLTDPGFVRDLRAQAEFSLENYPYIDIREATTGTEFVIYGTGGLSPFSPYGKCANPYCRIENALSFARSVGVYAEHAVIADFLSERVKYLDVRDHDDIESMFADVLVLQTLLPMMRAGIIRLAKPVARYCQVHAREAHELTTHVSNEIWRLMIEDVQLDFWPSRDQEQIVGIKSGVFDDSGRPIFVLHKMARHEAIALRRKLGWHKGKQHRR